MKHKLRLAAAILALILVTVLVVAAPHALYARKLAARVDTEVRWTFDDAGRVTVTPRDVARLYRHTEAVNLQRITAGSDITARVRSMLDELFTEDYQQNALRQLKEVCTSVPLDAEQQTLFTETNGKPLVLRLIAVTYASGDRYLHILYEDKTSAILNFSYSGVQKGGDAGMPESISAWADELDLGTVISTVCARLSTYARNTLGISDREFSREYTISNDFFAVDFIVDKSGSYDGVEIGEKE